MSRIIRFHLLIFAMLLLATVAASAQTLTVMELLQSPRQFEGRRVSVSGYYYSDWEGHGLFADRAAAERYDMQRGIWIAANPNVESSVRKAHVIGVFYYSSTALRKRRVFSGGFGPWGNWPTALVNATIHLR